METITCFLMTFYDKDPKANLEGSDYMEEASVAPRVLDQEGGMCVAWMCAPGHQGEAGEGCPKHVAKPSPAGTSKAKLEN